MIKTSSYFDDLTEAVITADKQLEKDLLMKSAVEQVLPAFITVLRLIYSLRTSQNFIWIILLVLFPELKHHQHHFSKTKM